MLCGITSPAMRVRRATAWVVIFTGLLLFTACEKKAAYTPPPPKVTVAQPARQNVTDFLEYIGNTQAINTVQLRARVDGYLEKVLFQDGQIVKKDQFLFLIQQNTYFAQLQQAEGNVLTQKALLEHATIEYARYSGLLKQKAAAETDVENWRYQRDSAQAGLLSAEAQRDLAKINLGYTWVVAPFNGRIDRRQVDPGNLVGPATTSVLAEFSRIDPLYVYFNVSESDLSRLMKANDIVGTKAAAAKIPIYMAVTNEEGFPHEGYLDFVATTVAQGTGTLLLRGVFPNPQANMLPGQFARTRIPVGKERSAILVPQVAMGFDQLGSYVLIVNGNNVVERRNVKTGIIKDSMYVVDDGLTGEEWVITKGLLRAAPGRPVTPEKETLSPPSGAAPTQNTDSKAGK
jgi:RND family efflux transporter MFP subunit